MTGIRLPFGPGSGREPSGSFLDLWLLMIRYTIVDSTEAKM